MFFISFAMFYLCMYGIIFMPVVTMYYARLNVQHPLGPQPGQSGVLYKSSLLSVVVVVLKVVAMVEVAAAMVFMVVAEAAN